jgi:hypothetical protein
MPDPTSRCLNSVSKYASVGSTAVDPEDSGEGMQGRVSAKLICSKLKAAIRKHRPPAGDQTRLRVLGCLFRAVGKNRDVHATNL